MLLNRLSVQNKILATLAVPFLVILAAAAVFTWVSIDNWRDANQVRDVSRFVGDAEELVTVIQAERDAAIAGLGSHTPMVSEGEETPEATSEAAARFNEIVALRNQALEALDSNYPAGSFDRIPDQAQQALEDARSQLRVGLLRAEEFARRGFVTPLALAKEYDDTNGLMFRFVATLGDTASARYVGTTTSTYESLYRYQDRMRSEAALIGQLLTSSREMGDDLATARERDVALRTRQVNDLRVETIQDVTSARIQGLDLLPSFPSSYSAVRQLVANGQARSVSAFHIDNWSQISGDAIDQITPLRETVREEMEKAALDSANNARTQAILTILGVVLAVAASLAIAYITSRSITNPLRHLARAADQVKNELPRLVEQMAVPGQTPDFELKPIEVESRDEVGQLAASFNSVNTTTIDVAREQAALRGSIAEMFVNVARRDHVLLNRQLGFLDELERAEEDPNTLANLFRLDHLATRMRRNSESLLVLAGIDSGRRVREPMAISDVVRTASSEIEQYDRIQLDLQADPLMLGHNALNSAHLIAELLENATNFSEPHTPVEVTTALSKHFMTVTIRDYGLGMSDQDIEEANRKVASRSATDVVGVQRVGLFVVGRLADRLGVHVAFSRPADGSEGTVIVLSFPFALFADLSEQPLPQPTDPLSRENQQAAQNWLQTEPEPEVVQEVNLEALTDGTTQTGMPKRRVSALPQAEAFTPEIPTEQPVTPTGLPSRGAGHMTGPDLHEEDIVLPPLQTPLAPVVSEDSDVSWAPATAAAPAASLPTRRASAQPVIDLAQEEEVKPQAPERRSAMFSSFRSFNPNDLAAADDSSAMAGEQPQQVDASYVEPDTATYETGFGSAYEPTVAPGGYEPLGGRETASHHTAEAVPSEELPPSFEPAAQVAYDTPPSFTPDAVEDAPYAPSALSASSGAEWAERFANLPTRASRAREARMAELSSPSPASPEEIEHSAQAPAQQNADDIWVPTFANGAAPQEQYDFAPAFDENAHGVAADEHSQYAQAGEYVPQQPEFQGYMEQPVGYHDEPVNTEWHAQQPAMVEHQYLEQPTVAQEPVFAPQFPDADVNPGGQQLPPSHPFTPISAPSVASPLDPTLYNNAPVASFADVVADVPETKAAPAKKGFLAKLFGKKDKTVPAAQAPVQQPTGQTFPPVFGTPSTAVTEPGQRPMDAPFGSFQPTPSPQAGGQTVPASAYGVAQAESQPSGVGTQAPSFNTTGAGAMEAPAQRSFRPALTRDLPQRTGAAPEPGQVFGGQQPFGAGGNGAADPTAGPSGSTTSFSPAVASPAPAGTSYWEPPAAFGQPNALALQSTIQEQAFAELSELSAYRPNAVSAGGTNLTRRVRGNVEGPQDDPSAQKISRDAAELRSRLSAFQSATQRGRQDGNHSPEQGAQASEVQAARVPDSVIP